MLIVVCDNNCICMPCMHMVGTYGMKRLSYSMMLKYGGSAGSYIECELLSYITHNLLNFKPLVVKFMEFVICYTPSHLYKLTANDETLLYAVAHSRSYLSIIVYTKHIL